MFLKDEEGPVDSPRRAAFMNDSIQRPLIIGFVVAEDKASAHGWGESLPIEIRLT